MNMQYCFFEDDQSSRFHPLTLTRPVDDLRTGILTLGEKWRVALRNRKWHRYTREELQQIYSTEFVELNSSCLLVNSRFLPCESLLNEIKKLEVGQLLTSKEIPVVAKVDGQTALKWQNTGSSAFEKLEMVSSIETRSIDYLWDLFLMNGDEIKADLERLNYSSSANVNVSPHAILENKENIFMG